MWELEEEVEEAPRAGRPPSETVGLLVAARRSELWSQAEARPATRSEEVSQLLTRARVLAEAASESDALRSGALGSPDITMC